MSHLTAEGACRGIFSNRFTEFACDKVMTDGKVKIYRKAVFIGRLCFYRLRKISAQKKQRKVV